jgi:hypothetical protein
MDCLSFLALKKEPDKFRFKIDNQPPEVHAQNHLDHLSLQFSKQRLQESKL